jgi:rSAM/selenodomain-associated transferase 1
MSDILLFCRYPRLGQVKTRLAAACGEEPALYLYKKMLRSILSDLDEIELKLSIFYTGCDAQEAGEWLPGHRLYPQVEGDLGRRLYRAAAQIFAEGATQVFLIGADCPGLDAALFEKAAAALLAGTDVVIGPATDGGYYLLGMKGLHAELFDDISWGTASVQRQTEQAAAKTGLKVTFLEEKTDMDFWHDIPELWRREAEEICP